MKNLSDIFPNVSRISPKQVGSLVSRLIIFSLNDMFKMEMQTNKLITNQNITIEEHYFDTNSC